MKTHKPVPQTSAEGECGVWLDTVQLKGKAKAKRLFRPISKLLNPLTGGYSVSVALNFTQTKLELPKTKQSSISTFFAPQRRVLNKMATSEVPNMEPVKPSSLPSSLPSALPSSLPSSSSSTSSKFASTAPTSAASGTKRRRETDLDLYNAEPHVDHEPEASVWQEQAASPTLLQNMQSEFEKERFEEMHSPLSKRRLTATSALVCDSQPVPLAWSQDPLFAFSQYSEDEFHLTNQKNTTEKNSSDSERSFLNTLQSEEAFGMWMDVERRTSTQKPFKHFDSSQMDDDKENGMFWSSKSPSKHSTVSHPETSDHKWTEPKTASPRKHIPANPWRQADKEESFDSQFKRAKPSCSPLKKTAPWQSCRAVDEAGLARLFTQDSEGFRVIAHRGLQARSPFKDQSNRNTGVVRTSAYESVIQEDEEDEMLFTQDSQGNMVIKH